MKIKLYILSFLVIPSVFSQVIPSTPIVQNNFYNAFPDLIRFENKLFCSYREAPSHYSEISRTKIIYSVNGTTWDTAVTFARDSFDLRDAKMSLTPDGRLMLLMHAHNLVTNLRYSFVSYSDDGFLWTPMERCTNLSTDGWLWKVSWYNNIAYGFLYGVSSNYIQLYKSVDGINYETVGGQLLTGPVEVNESSIAFRNDSAFAVVRRDPTSENAYMGASKFPFTNWQWTDLGRNMGGPCLITYGDKFILGARNWIGGQSITRLLQLNQYSYAIEKDFTLESSYSDNGYTGIQAFNDTLYCAYYNTPGATTSIVWAKVPLYNFTVTPPSNYFYYSGTGSLASTANWGSNPDGTGVHPVNFTKDQQTFEIRNTTAVATDAPWTVAGAGSKVILGSSVPSAPISLTVSHGNPINMPFTTPRTEVEVAKPAYGHQKVICQDAMSIAFGTINDAEMQLVFDGQNITSGINKKCGNVSLTNNASLTLTGAPTFSSLTIDEGSVLNYSANSNIKIASGGSVVVNGTLKTSKRSGLIGAGATFNFQGSSAPSLTLGPNSTIDYNMSGQGNQEIDALDFGNLIISGSSNKQFENGKIRVSGLLNITATGTISGLNDSMFIMPTGTMTIGAGSSFLTNGRLALKSSADGTAKVGRIDGNISGNVTIERFIGSSGARRAWRLITTPLRSTGSPVSVFDTWQMGGITGAGAVGKGTLITGPNASQLNGLDVTSGYSLKQYNGTNLQNVGDTKSAVLFSNASQAANKAYFIFVRGDRSSTNLSNSSVTTLSATGALQTGDQTFPTSSTPGAFTLIGNPYASPVDFDAFRADNAASNIKPNFYFWNPNLNGVGGNVTVSFNGIDGYDVAPFSASHTKYLQSGQAVYLQTKSSGIGTASVTFKESHKAANNVNEIFRPGTQLEKLHIDLEVQDVNSNWIAADGVMARYHNSYSVVVGDDDAEKVINLNENLSLLRENQLLSVESRPLIDNADTLFLDLTGTVTGKSYRFVFNPANFNAPLLQAYVVDNFLQTTLAVSLSSATSYAFGITSDTASASRNRFVVVYKSNSILPVQSISLKGTKSNAGIQLEWNSDFDNNTKSYEVERSADGIVFGKVNILAAVALATSQKYNWLDQAPAVQANYYRIKANELNGAYQYSPVIKVNMADVAGIKLFPNPVVGKTLNLEFDDKATGVYVIEIYNNIGQQLYTQKISHRRGEAVHSVSIPASFGLGSYQLKIASDSKMVYTTSFIIN